MSKKSSVYLQANFQIWLNFFYNTNLTDND